MWVYRRFLFFVDWKFDKEFFIVMLLEERYFYVDKL